MRTVFPVAVVAAWFAPHVLGTAIRRNQTKASGSVSAAGLDPTDGGGLVNASRNDRRVEQARLLFVGVYTAPTKDARQRREEIRATYWNHPLLKPGGPVEAKFIVGWSTETNEETRALEEDIGQRPTDFLRVDVLETYSNLTRKSMAFLRWFAGHGRAAFVLKMDDDTFPHFGPIVNQLREEVRPLSHLGMLFPCAPVLKFTKWAENEQVWNHSFFPKYMQGSGYFLSAPLVRLIAGEHYDRNAKKMLNNEDAAVGVWIEMLRWEDPNVDVEQRSVSSTLTGCQPGDLLSMNNQLGYMRCYWNRFLRGENDVCCYGPLDHLRQSLLQRRTRTVRQMAASATERSALRSRTALGCYGDW
eukprot:TRINITY_DN75962_c0_g1_i1.p1 TRINITY_DN75962_c0_g1~~TRINITY_DN75962_c0_g1_i1.p1  ORF type:complete len:358 (+),score=49.72 TRINITY_DN75962_c0_g1_i1:151-1224(+)